VFCQHDHWDEKKTDHYRYAKVLPDGRHLRTKISFGAGQVNDAGLFAAILRVELQVSETEFWRVVENHGPAQHTPLPQAIAPAAQPMRRLPPARLWSRPPKSQARAAESRTSWKKTVTEPPPAEVV